MGRDGKGEAEETWGWGQLGQETDIVLFYSSLHCVRIASHY